MTILKNQKGISRGMLNKDPASVRPKRAKKYKPIIAPANQKGMNLRKTELDTLCYLLERHIAEGNYFGRKDQHYKMCKELLYKLSQQLGERL